MTKQIIINLMAKHYSGKVSSTILKSLFKEDITDKDRAYIAAHGYELVESIPEKEDLNLDVRNEIKDHYDEINDCFKAYTETKDDVVINYCYTIFRRFVERMWINCRNYFIGHYNKPYDELEAIKMDYVYEGVRVFGLCFLNAWKKGHSPEDFFQNVHKRYEKDVFDTFGHLNYASSGYKSMKRKDYGVSVESYNDNDDNPDRGNKLDMIADNRNDYDEIEADDAFETIISPLSDRDKKIIRMHLKWGYTYDNIADVLKIDRSTVYRRIRASLSFLKKDLMKKGYACI